MLWVDSLLEYGHSYGNSDSVRDSVKRLESVSHVVRCPHDKFQRWSFLCVLYRWLEMIACVHPSYNVASVCMEFMYSFRNEVKSRLIDSGPTTAPEFRDCGQRLFGRIWYDCDRRGLTESEIEVDFASSLLPNFGLDGKIDFSKWCTDAISAIFLVLAYSKDKSGQMTDGQVNECVRKILDCATDGIASLFVAKGNN